MRFVLCDRQAMFLHSLAAALEARGHQVLAAAQDASAVVDLVADTRADALVSGLKLGEASVLDMAAEVKATTPRTVIVLMSGGSAGEAWEAYDSGVVDVVVSKAWKFEDVHGLINDAVRGVRGVRGWDRPIPPHASPFAPEDRLTPREREVLQLLVEGATTADIADAMGVSRHTVRTYVQSILLKLGVNGRAKAAHLAVELGLVAPQVKTAVGASLDGLQPARVWASSRPRRTPVQASLGEKR